MDVLNTFIRSPSTGLQFNSNPWMLRQEQNYLADFPSTNIYRLLSHFKVKENRARHDNNNAKATAYANMQEMLSLAVHDTVKMFLKDVEEPIKIDDSIILPIWFVKGLLGDWILPYAIHCYIPGFLHYQNGPSITFVRFKCNLLDLAMRLRTISKVENTVKIWAISKDHAFSADQDNKISYVGDENYITNVFVDESGDKIDLYTFRNLCSQINKISIIDPATQFPLIVQNNEKNILDKFFRNEGYNNYNYLRKIVQELFKDTVETDWEIVIPMLYEICKLLGKPFIIQYNLALNNFLYAIDIPVA